AKEAAMPDIEYDLRYLAAGLEGLDEYLHSDEVYWPLQATPLAGQPPFPQLTLDGLLLSAARLQAQVLPDSHQAEYQQLVNQLEAVRSKRRVAWEKKATHNFRARLTLWRNFMVELRDETDANADRYPYEVTRRVQLTLLSEDARQRPTAEDELVRMLDSLLETLLAPGAFIWDPELERGFPQSRFWFLYGQIKPQAKD
ncbi:MAG TPA: hypothetical protein VN363_10055, partial [Anaerolineales bacterium]|nr:hypothetical protein [Anaerolineales bacterium]